MDRILEIYLNYRQELYRYLLSLCRQEQLAEELVSETILAALLALPGYRGDGDVKTWLFSIARRKWADHLRKKGKAPQLDLAELYDLADPKPGPEDQTIRNELSRRAAELLDREDERSRAVVRCRLEGCSYREIARKLNIREGSARVMDFRVRQRIREQLKKEGYDAAAEL